MEATEGQKPVAEAAGWKRGLAAMAMATTLMLATFPAAAAGTSTGGEVQALFDDELLEQDYVMHTAKDQYEEALQVAEKAIATQPGSLEWRRRAARSAELAGRRQQALNHWLHLAKLGDGAARQTALRLTRSMHEFPVRRTLLEAELRAGNGDSSLLQEYIGVCQELGATSEAYDLLSSRITFANRELLLQELAQLAEGLVRPLDAVNALDQLAQIRPLTPDELRKRATLQFGAGDLQRDWLQAFGGRQDDPLPADELAMGESVAPSEQRRLSRWRDTRRTDDGGHRYLKLEPPTLGATVKYEFNRDERVVSGVKTSDTAQTVTERLELNSRGYLYHPALLQFGVKAAPEYTQRFNAYSDSSGDRSSNDTSFSPNYQLNATLLSQKPYTLTLFSQHLEAQTWTSYSGSTTIITDSYGADLALKYRLFPTSLGFSTSSSEQQGYYRSRSDWEEFHLLSRHSGKISGESSLSSTYSANQQVTDTIATDIKTFNTIITNQLKLTSDERLKLSSNLQYTYQDATSIRTNSLFINEQLHWRHLPNLQSQYLYSYRQITSTTSDNYWHSLEGRISHTLYENLTTAAALAATRNETNDGRQDTGSGVFSTDYRRRLGSWGQLGMTAGLQEQYNRRTGDTGRVQVSNEPHTLSIGSDSYLNQTDVELASIIVTNSSGGTIYLNGIDYRVDLVGSSLLISRLPLGGIGDGQQVLVSYSYTRSSGYTDQLLTQQYGTSLELFRLLFLSYRYLQADQTILSGTPPDRLSNSRIHLATARCDQGWGESAFSYEDAINNSDISYTRWEASQWFRLRYSNWLQANLRGYYGETSYRSVDDLKRTFGGTTGGYWSPVPWLRFTVEGYLEQTSGRLQRSVNGGGKLDLEATYRLWSARIGYKYTDQNDQVSDYRRRNQILQFQISRTMW